MTANGGHHIAIVGPTASGKSWLALEIARRHPEVELVSVDSMQVYRGMDIGTAKPSADEQGEVPHHLIDLVDHTDDFTLAEFQIAAKAAVADIEQRGKRAVLVGGTGLYLQAITDELELPGRYPEVRAELEVEEDTEALYRRLTALDSTTAANLQPENRRRIVRALEVTLGSGRPFSSFGPGIATFPTSRFRTLGVWTPREVNRERIDRRVEEMIQRGWVSEVIELQRKGRFSRSAGQALGYKELLTHQRGELDLSVAVGDIQRRTRLFARRQRVWFRRDPRVRWVGTPRDPRLLPTMLRACETWWERGGETSA